MKYYEMHESVYQRIKEQGHLSWDKSDSYEKMWAHETNTYLQKNLNQQKINFKNLKVLDLGTGTGTSALFSAKEGAQAVGVEYSQTAIEIAREHAQKLGLEVTFLQGNVLDLDLSEKFDIVIDSTVLHCIVGHDDRRRFYETVRKHIAPSGYFFINTMISSGDMSKCFPHEYFHFENNILWSLGINEITERKVINGKSYFPHRTLLSEADQLRELQENGFEALHLEVTQETDVKCLVGFLRLAAFGR